jgi:hypothetical protein
MLATAAATVTQAAQAQETFSIDQEVNPAFRTATPLDPRFGDRLAVRERQQRVAPRTVRERARPELDPRGIRAGSYFIFPQTTLAGEYNSNVNATNDDSDSAFVTVLNPNIDAVSNFSRHALNFRVGAESAFYSSGSENNYTDALAQADGRLDIRRTMSLDGLVRIARDHIARGSFDDDAGDVDEDVAVYNAYTGSLFFRQEFNRLFYRVGGAVQRRAFEESRDSNRDLDRYEPALRVGWQLSDRWTVFTQGSYYDVRYDSTQPDDRDFTGYRVGGGFNVDITELLFGEVFGGWEATNASGDFDDQSGPTLGSALTWNPTRLTSVRFVGSRSIRATTAVDSSTNFRTVLAVRVDHELRRNILGNLQAQYYNDDFDDAGAEDTYQGGGGIAYQLNRNFGVGLDYLYTTRNGDTSDRDYDQHRVRLGVTARL